MGTIFKREFRSYFTSPIGPTILTIFYFFSGLLFGVLFSSGIPQLSEMFSTLFIIVMAVIPILTMRLFSEEKRQKTDQLLYTSPVKLSSIALGKFLAASAVYSIALAILIVYQLIIALVMLPDSGPDWMVFFGNFLGLILYGCSLIAIGMFISSLTESQVIAAVVTFAVELVILLIDMITMFIDYDIVTKIVEYISVYERYNSFTRGTLDYANIVFFLSIIVIFVFLTIQVQDRKRYA